MAKHRLERGFTLIELLVVVAIIGIIAAIAIPNLLLAMQRAKQRRTMVDMRDMATAWEARAVELGRYNAAGGVEGASVLLGASTVGGFLSPTYMKTFPRHDAWGTAYAFFADQPQGSSVNAEKYAIVSAGQDLVISPALIAGPFTNYDCDIVYSNGSFLSYPEGLALK